MKYFDSIVKALIDPGGSYHEANFDPCMKRRLLVQHLNKVVFFSWKVPGIPGILSR